MAVTKFSENERVYTTVPLQKGLFGTIPVNTPGRIERATAKSLTQNQYEVRLEGHGVHTLAESQIER